MRRISVRLLLAAVVGGAIGLVALGPVEAAPVLQFTAIDCVKHPGLWDLIWIKNTGDAPLDLAGWQLRSDPEATQQMSLAPAGVIDPGEEIIVTAGAHGVNLPNENLYLWSTDEVLRDGGNPIDYVRLFDASGALAAGINCAGQPIGIAPEPTPAQAQPQTNASGNQPAASGVKSVPAAGGAAEASRRFQDILFAGAMGLMAAGVTACAGAIRAGRMVQTHANADKLKQIEGENRGSTGAAPRHDRCGYG